MLKKGIIIRRGYHNKDGRIAFEELKQGVAGRLGTEILVTKTEGHASFLARLPLTAEDTLLRDRASLMGMQTDL